MDLCERKLNHGIGGWGTFDSLVLLTTCKNVYRVIYLFTIMIFLVIGIEPRALYRLGKSQPLSHSTTEPHAQITLYVLLSDPAGRVLIA